MVSDRWKQTHVENPLPKSQRQRRYANDSVNPVFEKESFSNGDVNIKLLDIIKDLLKENNQLKKQVYQYQDYGDGGNYSQRNGCAAHANESKSYAEACRLSCKYELSALKSADEATTADGVGSQWKRSKCRYYFQGQCRFGIHCWNNHTRELCRFDRQGRCRFGKRCWNIHQAEADEAGTESEAGAETNETTDAEAEGTTDTDAASETEVASNAENEEEKEIKVVQTQENQKTDYKEDKAEEIRISSNKPKSYAEAVEDISKNQNDTGSEHDESDDAEETYDKSEKNADMKEAEYYETGSEHYEKLRKHFEKTLAEEWQSDSEEDCRLEMEDNPVVKRKKQKTKRKKKQFGRKGDVTLCT